MTGWQFRDLQQRHGALAHIPVIVVTGHSPVDIDAAAVLTKPFAIEELCRVLRTVLGRGSAAARSGVQTTTDIGPRSRLGDPLPRLLP